MPQNHENSREIDEEDRKRRQQALRSLAQADQDNVTSNPTDGAASAFSRVDASPLLSLHHAIAHGALSSLLCWVWRSSLV